MRPKRTIVVAASLTTAAETALQWVLDNMAKEGDAIHICHVCKVHRSCPKGRMAEYPAVVNSHDA